MAEPSKDLLEALAHVEHERWADWQRHMFSKCQLNPDGTMTIPKWGVDNWSRQIDTTYADLTEAEKESDRREVRRYWEVIEGHNALPINETLVAAMREAITAVKNPMTAKQGDMAPACNYAARVLEEALIEVAKK